MLLALMRMEIFRYLMVAGLVSSSLHVDIRKKYILLLGKGPAQRLDDTTLAAKKEYAINFREQHKKICLSLHYNNANRWIIQIQSKRFWNKCTSIMFRQFQKVFQLIVWKWLDDTDMSMIFQSIMIVLMLLVFYIFINIWWLRKIWNKIMLWFMYQVLVTVLGFSRS